MIKSFASAWFLVAAGCSVASALPLSSWVSCLAVPNSSCTLDPGSYSGSMLSAYVPITIASGVTANGGGTSPYSTTLQRPSNWTGNMFYVASGSSVTITNLLFDGNRYSFPNAQTGCGTSSTSPCGPLGGFGCTVTNWNSTIDVNVDGYAFIDNVAFWNSPGYSLYINLGNVYYASVYYSRSTGAWLHGGGTVDNGAFQYNGTTGLRVSGTAGANVYYNNFFQNRYEMPDGSGGGQLYIDYSAANITVGLNTIDGNNWQTTTSNINGCYPPTSAQGVAGIEVEPYATAISMQANDISNNTGNGISVHSANVEISGYSTYPNNPRYIHNNTGSPSGYTAEGVKLYHTSYGASTAKLDYVLSRNNSSTAVDIDPTTNGIGWVGAHCVDSYTPSINYSFNPGGQYPTNTTTCP